MRYEVQVRYEAHHSFAVEAENPTEAQAKAMNEVGNRDPERVEIHVDVERGSR